MSPAQSATRRTILLRLGTACFAVGTFASPLWSQDLAGPWAHFDVGRVQAVVIAADQTPWAVLPDRIAWYDGYQWQTVPGSAGLDRSGVAAAAPSRESGLLLRISGSLFRVRRDGIELVVGPASGWYVAAAVAWDERLIVEASPADGDRGERTLLELKDGQLRPFEPGPPRPSESVAGLWATRSGALWVFTDSGLWRMSNDTWSLHASSHTGGYLDVTHVEEEPNGSGHAYVRFPTESAGLWEWRPGAPARRTLPDDGPIRSLVLQPDGTVLVAGQDGTLARPSAAGWNRIDPAPAALSQVRWLATTADDDLWVGGENGLYVRHATGQRSTALLPRSGGAADRINEIVVRSSGETWFATGLGLAVLRTDGSTDRLTRIGTTDLGAVTGLAEDQAGDLWITSGSSFRGAYRLRDDEWESIGTSHGIDDGYFHRAVIDSAGDLWLLGLRPMPRAGRRVGGLGAFRRTAEGFERWGEEQGLKSGQVYDVLRAPDGALWFATALGVARHRDGAWTVWGKDQGLVEDRVFDLEMGADGTVYVADQMHGLGTIAADEVVRYVTSSQGLPLGAIWGLQRGPDDRIWMGGEGGVAVLLEDSFFRFATSRELPALDVWPLTFADNRLLVGTLGGGATAFDLSGGNAPPPRLILGPVSTRGDTALLQWEIFTWEARRPQHEIQTRYRIDDAVWSSWDSSRAAQAVATGGPHRIVVEARDPLVAGTLVTATATFSLPIPLVDQGAFWLALATLGAVAAGATYGHYRRLRGDRKAALEREAHLRSIFDHASDAVLTLDARSRVTFVNRAALQLAGVPADAILGQPADRIIDTKPFERSLEASENGSTTGSLDGSRTVETELRTCDGFVPVEVSARAIDTPGSGSLLLIGRDLRPALQTDAQLHDLVSAVSAETDAGFFATLAENLANAAGLDYAFVCSLDNADSPSGPPVARTIATWSRFGQLEPFTIEAPPPPYGHVLQHRQAVFGDHLREDFPAHLVADDPEVRSWAGILLGGGDKAPVGILAAAGRGRIRAERSVRSTLQLFGIRAAAELDRLENERTLRAREQELRQAQKMDAVGRLAGGIAHDFNNLLTVITGAADLARSALDLDHPARPDLDMVLSSADNAAQLTRHLLAFTRDTRHDPGPSRIGAEIEAMAPLLRSMLGAEYPLRADIGEGSDWVPIGSLALQQILMNLTVNAGQAGDTSYEVVLRVRRRPDGGIRVQVVDRGRGMDRHTQERAFEPFFTTRPVGEGSGLGLSTVYALVGASGGTITIVSELGSGTTVSIDWPATAADGAGAVDERPLPAREQPPRILVVDDEDGVRELIKRTLATHGLEVIAAASAQAALEQVAALDGPLDLLLTDLRMPGMDGIELAHRVRDRWTEIPVILTSGYHDLADENPLTNATFLAKPWSPQELLQRVRGVLER